MRQIIKNKKCDLIYPRLACVRACVHAMCNIITSWFGRSTWILTAYRIVCRTCEWNQIFAFAFAVAKRNSTAQAGAYVCVCVCVCVRMCQRVWVFLIFFLIWIEGTSAMGGWNQRFEKQAQILIKFTSLSKAGKASWGWTTCVSGKVSVPPVHVRVFRATRYGTKWVFNFTYSHFCTMPGRAETERNGVFYRWN